jgi:uncharacterized protein YabE (DUF348 family)
MKKTRLYALALVIAFCGLMLLGLGLQKTVTIDIDGEATEMVTSAWTVGALLEEVEVTVGENDAIAPPLETWLWGGEVISINRAAWVTLHADGETTSLNTLERSPANLLEDAGLRLLPGDQLLVDGQPSEVDEQLSPGRNHSLQIRRAQQVSLVMGEELLTFSSTAATLGEALWENGIELNAGDRLEPAAETPLDRSIEAQLKEAQELIIQHAGGRIRSRSAAESVAEALSEAGVSLQGLDYSVPDEQAPLPKDGKIRVIRVREELLLENEPIPYETETQPAPDVEIDNREIVQSGVLGLNTQRLRVRYEDEVEVARSAEGEYISLEPQTEIIGYGTKIVPYTLDTPSGEITYWRALNMYAIAYNPTSAGDDVTATGLRLEKGIVAIDPTIIPYGTEMYVPGYGRALAADTGGGIKGRMIDLGYSDDDYVSWHEWVTVYFLWPPPENVVWVIP